MSLKIYHVNCMEKNKIQKFLPCAILKIKKRFLKLESSCNVGPTTYVQNFL